MLVHLENVPISFFPPYCIFCPMQFSKHLRLFIVALGLAAAIGIVMYGSGTVFASHSFEAGVSGNNIPDNTHVRLDGLSLPAGGVLPVYDASPNFIAGHLL